MRKPQYDDNLTRIEDLNPGEPLLPVLRTGYSPINVIYMEAALKRLPTTVEPDDIDQDDEPEIEMDDILISMWNQRRILFGLMNKESNKFHTCRSDHDRKVVSEKIMDIWGDIQTVKSKIAYYQIHRELPAADNKAETPADNPLELTKQINSIRARISQRKSKLEKIAGLDPSTPGKQSQIDQVEKEIVDLKYLLGVSVQKLDNYGKD